MIPTQPPRRYKTIKFPPLGPELLKQPVQIEVKIGKKWVPFSKIKCNHFQNLEQLFKFYSDDRK